MAKKSNSKTHPHGAELDRLEAEEKEREDVKAVQLYENLLIAADGGEPFLCGEFYASTILAMFKNQKYAKRIEKLHDRLQNG